MNIKETLTFLEEARLLEIFDLWCPDAAAQLGTEIGARRGRACKLDARYFVLVARADSAAGKRAA